MSDWLDRHTARAPAVLRAAVLRHLENVPATGTIAEHLSRAGWHALSRVTGRADTGREVALDLLAADALITLALLAQAQSEPAALEDFASSLLEDRAGAG